MFFYVYFLSLLLAPCACEWKFKIQDSNKLLLKYSLVSTKITDENDESLAKQLEKGVEFVIKIKPELKYTLFIKLKSSPLITSRTEVLIFETDIPNQNPFEYDLVEGYVTNATYSSFVIGYTEDVYFYGKIVVYDTIYYIEKLENYPHIKHKCNTTKNGILFKRTFEPEARFDVNDNTLKLQMQFYNTSKIYKRMTALRGNICSLLVLLDNSFITRVHFGKVHAALKQVLLAIDEANSLFRSTDFDEDGFADNIGFTIKYFILLKSSNESRWVPKYTAKPIDGRYYMNRFSRFYLLEDVCLGVAFTGQSFISDIVGISYSAVPSDGVFKQPYGGICDRPMLNPYGLPLNTLAVSARSTDGKFVPEYVFELSLCHELGHSFGSDHDKGKCDGYLMTSHAPKNQNRKHFLFSKCSTSAIMRTISKKGYCFEIDETPYCGNGIIEGKEECDCGTIRDCLELDKCCVPRGRSNSCKIKRELGHKCHPAQGICCTDECEFRNLKRFDLDCANFQRGCPCAGASAPCKCGTRGYCKGDVCVSEECARINAAECNCPESETAECFTCCESPAYGNTCLQANELTQALLHLHQLNISALRTFTQKKKSKGYGYSEHYCDGEDCVWLNFRKVKKTEYCLSFGRVGTCLDNNHCEVPTTKTIKLRRYDSLDHQHNFRNNALKAVNHFSVILLLFQLILLL
ncbi:unnamed protein product [Phyllotreta striolata]|uniref:Uncharacterized protein n=1 Tax=Phyllotreta striolata TaxID=444603 RepID=A0A9N9TZ63_PHYSR|nr:unnamed protein product [Phyllotreta striolata]